MIMNKVAGQALINTQLRGLLQNEIKKNLTVRISFGILSGVAYYSTVREPRKRSYPHFFRLVADFVMTKAMIKYWEIKGWTVHQVFDETVKDHPMKDAIRLGETSWNFQMLSDYSLQVANFFKENGLRRGDVVALFMENQPRYVGLWLGLSRLGVVTALINTQQKLQGLSHAITVSRSKAVICDTELLPALYDLQNSKWALPDSVILFRSGPEKEKDLLIKNINLDPLLEEASRKPMDAMTAKQINLSTKILYIYTSGTTGLPKAAIMTHHRFVFLAVAIHKSMHLSRKEVVYTPMPLFHTAGGLLGTGQVLLFGNTMVIRKKFSATSYFRDCRKYGATVGQYIGEINSFIMEKVKEVKDHNVKLMIGNGMRPQIWDEFKQRYKVKRIGEFYGSTEGNANMINNCDQTGAVGLIPWYGRIVLPIYLIEYDVETMQPLRDKKTELCREVPVGSPGILVGKIKQTSSSSFEGYADEKATEKKIIRNVFKHGDKYFNSGDILKMDKQGFFYFLDRLGDTYRWNGENIASSEVEMVIFQGLELQPNQVAVFGVEVPRRPGKAGMAVFALSDDEQNTFDLDKLTAIVTAHLSDPQQPVFLRIASKMPKTATEKVKKIELQKEGYDPATISDILYYKVRNREAKMITYTRLTPEVYSQIQAGTLQL